MTGKFHTFTLTPVGRDALKVSRPGLPGFEIDGAFLMEVIGGTDDGKGNYDMEQIQDAIAMDAYNEGVEDVAEVEQIAAAAVKFLVDGELPAVEPTPQFCVIVRDVDDGLIRVVGPLPEHEANNWAHTGEESLLRDWECTREQFDGDTDEDGRLLTDGMLPYFDVQPLDPPVEKVS